MNRTCAYALFVTLLCACDTTASSIDAGDAAGVADAQTNADADATASSDTSVADAPANVGTQATCEAYLAANPNPSGIPAVPPNGTAQRTALLAAGGKLVAIDDRYFVVWIPKGYYTAKNRVLVLSLHGTAGYPEAEWNDWHANFESAGIAFASLAWEGGTDSTTSDSTAYDQLKRITSDLAKVCPTNDARKWVMGFSVGGALSFAVIVRDVADKKLFLGNIANSGMAWNPMASGTAMHPTVEDAKGNAASYAGATAWMYCGEKDITGTWVQCDAAVVAQTYVNTHGGTSVLLRDPQGEHGSLPKTPAEAKQLLDYLTK